MQMKSLNQRNNYIVYKHTSPSGKVYIGITCQNICKRWKNGKGYDLCTAFHRAIVKYGWNNIRHEILYTGLTKQEACEKEIELIREHKSNNPEYGYNLTSGGEHYEQGQDAINRLSASLKKYYAEHPEAKIRLSESQKGKKISVQARENHRKARNAYLAAHPEMRLVCGNSRRGTHLSPEARQRLREVNQKKVICIETKQIFNSVTEAASFVGVCKSSVSNNLTGKTKKCGGYSFAYVE